MSTGRVLSSDHNFGTIQRETICLPDISRDTVLHAGDAGFVATLLQYFVTPENNAAEQLIVLKAKLRSASTHDFWNIVLEGICGITGSQCGFISKRILVDDQNTAVEMPPLGEPGSCLMGIGFYLAPSNSVEELFYHNYMYQSYGSPCEYMKHDKVFIVPERMTEFIPNNPNTLPFKCEAYIGVPLFSEGKCFAHFGMIWSDEGAKNRNLGWGFIEMFLHSLEDMILQRILEGKGFAKEAVPKAQAKLIPLNAITASQSLKPYARSLSHELRTPMQGVVGMLDIMYTTILGSMEAQPHEHVRAVFQDLKRNIEQAQDSSKRAVEAADAVVHAYDLNMQMPDTALPSSDGEATTDSTEEGIRNSRPGIVIEGSGISLFPKRKRIQDHDFHGGPPLKKLAYVNEQELCRVYDKNPDDDHTAVVPVWLDESNLENVLTEDIAVSPARMPSPGCIPRNQTGELTPTHKYINTREFLRKALDQSLENKHTERKIHTPNERGEVVEVRTRGPKGDAIDKTVSLIVSEKVPDTIVAEEAIFQLALHKVVDNAIKFTDTGNITIAVELAQSSRALEIRVTDQGCGITTEAQANLFKPFSQQDPSLSRQKEGLGLSLYVAKARTRQKLGGDIILEKSETDGPNKGSQFLIRLPLSASKNDDTNFPPLIGTPTANPCRERLRTITPQRTAAKDGIPFPSSQNGETSSICSAPSTLRSLKPTPHLITPQNTRPTTSFSTRKTTPYNSHLAKEHPLTFLVAEDNALNRMLLVKCLESLGYSKEDILVATDGVEAVELYRSSLGSGKRKVDIILMDLWMPNLDGYQATERILEISKKLDNKENSDDGDRRDHFGDLKEKGVNREREPAVMAITADITSESQERARKVGMKGFMSKPYKVIDMQNLIRGYFCWRTAGECEVNNTIV